MAYEHKINAAGKKLGRIASEAAKVLMGKHSAQFENNRVADVRVVIENASKLDVTYKKKRQEVRKRYTGYPGGQRVDSLGEFVERKGIGETVKDTVKRMLPRNRLRDARMKNLIVGNE